MDIFTGITKSIGTAISKVKSNNTLLEELNKKYNPTFIDIVDDLTEKGDTILLSLLYQWYTKNLGIDPANIETELESIKLRNSKEYQEMIERQIKKFKSSSGGCGSSSDYYNSGCGSPSNYYRPHYNSGGCGSSYSNDSHC